MHDVDVATKLLAIHLQPDASAALLVGDDGAVGSPQDLAGPLPAALPATGEAPDPLPEEGAVAVLRGAGSEAGLLCSPGLPILAGSTSCGPAEGQQPPLEHGCLADLKVMLLRQAPRRGTDTAVQGCPEMQKILHEELPGPALGTKEDAAGVSMLPEGAPGALSDPLVPWDRRAPRAVQTKDIQGEVRESLLHVVHGPAMRQRGRALESVSDGRCNRR